MEPEPQVLPPKQIENPDFTEADGLLMDEIRRRRTAAARSPAPPAELPTNQAAAGEPNEASS